MTCADGICGTGGWAGPLPGDPDNTSVLSATPAFGGVDVSWTYPTTNPFAVAHTVVYRGLTADFARAINLATVGGNHFFDKTDPTAAVTYYYWIVLVSVHGTYGATIGPASATTQVLSAVILGLLTGDIELSELSTSLKSDIASIALNYTQLLAEIENRISGDTALSTAFAELQSGVDQAIAFVNTEITTRIAGDTALASQVNLVAAANSANAAAITTEQTARVAADSALTTQYNAVLAATNTNAAAIATETTARTNADSAAASTVVTLQSRVNADPGMTTRLFWGFDSTTDSWTGTNATLTPANGLVTVAPTAGDPQVGITFAVGDRFTGSAAPVVRARIRRSSGATGTWEGACYYSTAGHAISTTLYYKQISEPVDPTQWSIVEWDMAALTKGETDWTASEIRSLRIDLVSGTGSSWEVDWISVGQRSATPAETALLKANTEVGMATRLFWPFSSVIEPWIPSSATALFWRDVNGVPTSFATSNDSSLPFRFLPTAASSNLAVSFAVADRFLGSIATTVRARIRRISGTSGDWDGTLYYATLATGSNHGYVSGFRKQIAEPSDPTAWNVVEWDMRTLTAGATDWVNNTITGLRLNLVTGIGTAWEVDWISVGQRSTTPLDASLQVEATTRANQTGELYAQYTVKVDVAGLVSGYGLASTANTAAPTSLFGVQAGKFFVAPPALAQAVAPVANLFPGMVWLDTSVNPNVTKYYTGAGWSTDTAYASLPFVVITVPTVVDGKTIQPGVYMKSAMIQALSADKITAGAITASISLTAAKLLGGQFTAYAWPTTAGGGYYLGPEGLLLGTNGVTVNATTMVSGKYYRVVSIGSTDFTTVGGANSVGYSFKATGTPAGTGTVVLESFFQVTAAGQINAPGFSIVDGVLTISQLNVIGTSNVQPGAITSRNGATLTSNFALTLTSQTVLSATVSTADNPIWISAGIYCRGAETSTSTIELWVGGALVQSTSLGTGFWDDGTSATGNVVYSFFTAGSYSGDTAVEIRALGTVPGGVATFIAATSNIFAISTKR